MCKIKIILLKDLKNFGRLTVLPEYPNEFLDPSLIGKIDLRKRRRSQMNSTQAENLPIVDNFQSGCAVKCASPQNTGLSENVEVANKLSLTPIPLKRRRCNRLSHPSSMCMNYEIVLTYCVNIFAIIGHGNP